MSPAPVATPGPALTRRVHEALHRWPLSARLVAVIVVLVATGLVLAGVASATLLQRSLVAQVDTRLADEANETAQQTVTALQNGYSGYVPTDYVVEVTVNGVEPVVYFRKRVVADYGLPRLPELTDSQAVARAGRAFTVRSDTPDRDWRAVVYPFDTGGGYVTVALPLGDVHETTRRMTTVLLVSGLGIVLLGAGVGAVAVRRSLRPLREIESTAAAIAAGDLSRRIPPAPAQTEVGRLGAALNGMLTQIEQAFAVRTASEARMRRFVADASHELRTPLATIRGYAELYRMGALNGPEQLDDTMSRIEGSATRLGGLVDDLLALARLDEGRPLDLSPQDLTVLAADAAADLRALAPGRPVRLEPLRPGEQIGPVHVLADDARIRQVLANLVGNVVRHTPDGVAAEVAVGLGAGPDGRPVGVVEVRDHGPGIDPEHAARVFERFYRVDASRTRDSGGAGLGMAIVAAIVQAHDGLVELAQTPGGGTTVRVVLPTVPTEDRQP